MVVVGRTEYSYTDSTGRTSEVFHWQPRQAAMWDGSHFTHGKIKAQSVSNPPRVAVSSKSRN